MNADQLRILADQANRNKAAAKERRVQKQVDELYAVLRPLAAEGRYEATYRGDLCTAAQKLLREDGLKIRNDGGDFASVYHIKW